MSWMYDEMKQVGVDFESASQVAEYDAQQGSNYEAEQALIAQLGVEAGQCVVDLGCGTGSFAREAARCGANVRAVDVSAAMLGFVKQAADTDGLTNLQVEHAGFLTFQAEPDSIDCVVTRFALHHLPDFWKQVALLRLAKSIRSSGCLFLRDVVFSFDPNRYESGVDGWVDRMPSLSGFAREDFETHVREEYSTYAWILEGMIERAGFEIVEKAFSSDEYANFICRPKG